jgi:uncharacterized membrane protein YfcA
LVIMTDQTARLLLIAATFFLAGIVKGVSGMGLPTVAMALLGALLSPLEAAGLLIMPSFITNVWQLAAGPALPALSRRLWPMMAALVCGTLLAAPLLAGGGKGGASTIALGAVLCVYALYTLLAGPLRVPPRLERWLQAPAGLATGLVTGATGVFVIPAVPWLQALGLRRDELVQALGLSFTLSTLALAGGLALQGGFNTGNLPLSLLATLPALAGMAAGQKLRQRVSPLAFRRGFLFLLLLLGMEMLTRPL